MGLPTHLFTYLMTRSIIFHLAKRKFLGILNVPTRKVLLQTLENFFYIQHEVNHPFMNKPTFSKYTEAAEIYQRMLKIKLPDKETWEIWCELL